MEKIAKLFFSVIALCISVTPSSFCLSMNLTRLDKPVAEIFGDTISFLLLIAGGITLLVIIFSGVLYVATGANPDAQNRAKKTFSYAVVGLVVVLMSYAVILVLENIVVL